MTFSQHLPRLSNVTGICMFELLLRIIYIVKKDTKVKTNDPYRETK